MTPAVELTAASARLRALAGGATPGDLATCACGHHIDEHGDVAGCIWCECDLARQGVVAAAVARHAMSPPVALAVADWLDLQARGLGATTEADHAALAVARAINEGARA